MRRTGSVSFIANERSYRIVYSDRLSSSRLGTWMGAAVCNYQTTSAWRGCIDQPSLRVPLVHKSLYWLNSQITSQCSFNNDRCTTCYSMPTSFPQILPCGACKGRVAGHRTSRGLRWLRSRCFLGNHDDADHSRIKTVRDNVYATQPLAEYGTKKLQENPSKSCVANTERIFGM